MTDSFLVTIPAGLVAGHVFVAQTPDGRQCQVTVPPGLAAGSPLQVQMPPLAPVPIVQGVQVWNQAAADDGGDDQTAGSTPGDAIIQVDGVIANPQGLQYFSPEQLQLFPPPSAIYSSTTTSTTTTTTANFLLTQLPVEGFGTNLVPREVAPKLSDAETEPISDFTRATSGRQSFDPRLETVDELTRYFQTHNTYPTLSCTVHGYHKKTSGSGKKKRTHTVTDFRYEFDLTSLVSPYGYIQATPTEQGEPRSLPQVLEDYCASTNSLKELRMIKTITGFDFETVRQAFVSRLRDLGFRRRISIGFEVGNNCAKVITPTWQAKAANSPAVKCFCVVTCLCIIGWPLRTLMRDLQDTIHSNFAATTNANTWVAANLHRLHCTRSQHTPIGGSGAWDPRRPPPPQPTHPALPPVVASGYGATPDNEPVAEGVPLDTNGDGVIDSVGFDTTGDNMIDVVVPRGNEAMNRV